MVRPWMTMVGLTLAATMVSACGSSAAADPGADISSTAGALAAPVPGALEAYRDWLIRAKASPEIVEAALADPDAGIFICGPGGVVDLAPRSGLGVQKPKFYLFSEYTARDLIPPKRVTGPGQPQDIPPGYQCILPRDFATEVRTLAPTPNDPVTLTYTPAYVTYSQGLLPSIGLALTNCRRLVEAVQGNCQVQAEGIVLFLDSFYAPFGYRNAIPLVSSPAQEVQHYFVPPAADKDPYNPDETAPKNVYAEEIASYFQTELNASIRYDVQGRVGLGLPNRLDPIGVTFQMVRDSSRTGMLIVKDAIPIPRPSAPPPSDPQPPAPPTGGSTGPSAPTGGSTGPSAPTGGSTGPSAPTAPSSP